MTGQTHILTELKSSWPVILTRDLQYLPLFWAPKDSFHINVYSPILVVKHTTEAPVKFITTHSLLHNW
jgi:hypothetical protein